MTDWESRLADFLLHEVAPGTRLVFVVVALYAAFGLGALAVWYQPTEHLERIERLEEHVRTLEHHRRALWAAYERVRTRQDRGELERVNLSLPQRRQ